MAIKLIANYSKRLGLPGYSSHQFSVSVETELVATDDIATESGRLYQLLQTNVDEQILATGFVPPADYGMDSPADSSKGGTSAPKGSTVPREAPWRCTDRQRDLILRVVEEHKLDKNEVDALANQRFGKGVKYLNKIEASGFIDELLETHGGEKQGGGNRRNGSAYKQESRAA